MNVGRILDSIDSTLQKNSARGSISHQHANGVEVEEKAPDRQETAAIVEKLNKSVEHFGGKLSFHYHEKTNRVIMKVLDPATHEVVREIPAKDAIKLLEHIQDFLGMLVDESR